MPIFHRCLWLTLSCCADAQTHKRTTQQQHSNTCDSASPIAPPAPPVLLPAQPPAKHQVKSHECDQDDLAPHVSETRTSKSSHASQRAHTRPHVLRQTLAREAPPRTELSPPPPSERTRHRRRTFTVASFHLPERQGHLPAHHDKSLFGVDDRAHSPSQGREHTDLTTTTHTHLTPSN